MTAKTKKEFQAENSELREKLRILQAELISEKEKRNGCTDCDKKLDDGNFLKKQKNRSSFGVYKCDQCNKEFDQGWKLSAHEKKHKRYQCDKCENCYEYLDILKKHKLVSHENTKLYCHFYNNEKTCPYDERCIFLHKDSKFCKYDTYCERDLCMFKHGKVPIENENIDPNDICDEVIDIIEIESETEEARENEKSEMCENDSDKTFHNPSQEDNTLKFKCNKCDFESATKPDLVKHKTEIHNWCIHCFSSFDSQDKLKEHIFVNH